MLIIKYNKEGEAISDFKALKRVKEVVEKVNQSEENVIFHVSSDRVVALVQSAIALGIIECDKVKYIIELNEVEKEIKIDKNGQFEEEVPFNLTRMIIDAWYGKNIFQI